MKVSRFVHHYLVIIALRSKERQKVVCKMIKMFDNRFIWTALILCSSSYVSYPMQLYCIVSEYNILLYVMI